MPLPTAKDLAQSLMTDLGQNITIPAVDLSDADFAAPDTVGNPLYGAIQPLDMDDLTTGIVDGAGAFDVVMTSTKAHLKEQYDKGRITGDQYTKAYIELSTAALNTALQFLLSKDTTLYQAALAQAQARRAEIEAVTARVALETAKAQLATAKAQYVLIMLQTASESAKYDLTNKQIDLVGEQTEAQRAQTLDTRLDGTTPVTGVMGKQKDLYNQQITSYQRDSEYKAAKMFVDSWITQKTIDEGLTAPNELTNATLETVLGRIRTLNGLT